MLFSCLLEVFCSILFVVAVVWQFFAFVVCDLIYVVLNWFLQTWVLRVLTLTAWVFGCIWYLLVILLGLWWFVGMVC